MLTVLRDFVGTASRVYNFDAHHDILYSDFAKCEPDCGSWVYHACKKKLIADYNLVYPAWRKDIKENLKQLPQNILKKTTSVYLSFLCLDPALDR